MKAGWEEVRLDDLCKIARGGSPRPIKEYITDAPDGINWIKIGDTEMGGRYIDTTKEKIKPSGIARSRYVEAGSFLLSNSMSFGRPYLLRTNGCIHDGWLVLEPDYSRVDQDYLYYALSSRVVFEQFNSLAAGATVRNLNIDLVSKVVAPIPPLEEQKRIVAVLDAAFEGLTRAKENAEANLQNARELFEATVTVLLSNPSGNWERAKLAEYCEKITVGHVGPMASKYVEQGVPFLRSQNVRPYRIDLDNVKYIDQSFHSELAKSKLSPGDVAIVRTGYPGTSAVISDDLLDANCADLVIAKTGPKLDAHFLALLLNSDYGKKLVAGAAVGAAQKHFNVGAAKEALFDFPPLFEQRALVEKLEVARGQLSKLEKYGAAKLTDIADLRQSLLQKAFAGELT